MKEKTFPEVWKKQKLDLLPKPNKRHGDPSSYRPICLLDTAGKIFERIIYNRLLPFVELNRGLSERQFGFRKNRSTTNAICYILNKANGAIKRKGYCALITLHVKNAFNSAK